MNKKVVFITIVLIFISYVIYNIRKNFPFSIPSVTIGMENKICKRIKSNYLHEDLFKLNDNYIIAPTFSTLLQTHEYLEGKKIPNGKIFALNLKNETFFEIPIRNFPKNISFDPFAVDILNKEYLFVINHRTSKEFSNEQIEIFKIILNEENGIELSYFKSIILPNEFFGTLNAIAVKDLETFYFTTWKYFPEPNSPKEMNSFFKRILYKIKSMVLFFEIFLDLKLTNVFIYHKGNIKKIENSNAIFNNGLAYDDKNKYLYAARTIEKDIKVYKVSEKGDEAKLDRTINIPYYIDNVYYQNEKLNLGISPNMMELFKVIEELNKGNDGKNIVQYSGFLEIDLKTDKIVDILLQNDFKGVSSGIKVGNKIIMTSIAFKGLYICENK